MRRLTVAVLLLVVSACGVGAREAADTPTQRPEPRATLAGDPSLEPAHDFTVATLDGDTFTLSDHFGELPVVLNFWAPW